MASKTGQITIKKNIVERLDERRNYDQGVVKSYSEVIDEMFMTISEQKVTIQGLEGLLKKKRRNNGNS